MALRKEKELGNNNKKNLMIYDPREFFMMIFPFRKSFGIQRGTDNLRRLPQQPTREAHRSSITSPMMYTYTWRKVLWYFSVYSTRHCRIAHHHHSFTYKHIQLFTNAPACLLLVSPGFFAWLALCEYCQKLGRFPGDVTEDPSIFLNFKKRNINHISPTDFSSGKYLLTIVQVLELFFSKYPFTPARTCRL